MAEDSPEPGVYEVTSVTPEGEKAPAEAPGDSESEGAGRAILSALGLAAMILVIGLLGLVRLFGWAGVAIAAGVLVGAAVLAKTTLGKAKNGRKSGATRGGGRSGWKPGGAGGGGRWGLPKGRGKSAGAKTGSRIPGLRRGNGKAGAGGSKAGRGNGKAGGASGATQKGRLGRLLPLGRGSKAGRATQGGSKRGRLGGSGRGPAFLRGRGKAGGGSGGGSASKPRQKRGRLGKAKGSHKRRRRWLTLGLPLAWAAWRGRGKGKAEEGGSKADEPRLTVNQRLAAWLQEGYERAELATRGLGGRIRGWIWEPKKADPEAATQPEAAPSQTPAITPGGPSGYTGGGSTNVELNNPEVPDGMLDYRSFLVEEAAGVEEAATRARALADIAETDLPVADAFRDVVGEYAAAWGLVAEMGAELIAEFASSHETEIGRLESPRVNEQLWDTNNNDA